MTTKEHFAQLWEDEAKTTASAFRAVPADKWDYTPHPKTRSAKRILTHLAFHGDAILEGIEKGVINLGPSPQVNSPEEAAKIMEASIPKIKQAVSKTDEKTWNEKMVPMKFGDKVVYEAPMGTMVWSFLLDVIHHRGQLSTYYRPMGVRNPSIYGPTVEMEEEQMAAAQ